MWEAFNALSLARGRGMVVEPIRFDEIRAWLDLAGICDQDLRLEWTTLISGLDQVFLEEMAKRQPPPPSGRS